MREHEVVEAKVVSGGSLKRIAAAPGELEQALQEMFEPYTCPFGAHPLNQLNGVVEIVDTVWPENLTDHAQALVPPERRHKEMI